MLKIIPPLYKDEIIYSWYARYHTYSGNRNTSQTILDLNNRNSRYTNFKDCFDGLVNICNHLPKEFNITPSTIIKLHTAYPIYELLYNRHSNNIIHNFNKVSPSICYFSNLKICKKCLTEQYDKYGETFLNKYYQNTYIHYCHIHYEPLLEYYKKNDDRNFSDINRMPPSNFSFKVPNKLLSYENHFIAISNLNRDIMNHTANDLDLINLRKVYLYRLKDLGFINNRRFKSSSFLPEFKSYYTQDFLNFFNITTNNWISNIFKEYDNIPPIKHYLMIIFLFGSFQIYFLIVKTYAL